MNVFAKSFALIPEIARYNASTSTALALASAAVIGQGVSQGWSREAAAAHAREYRVKPYFAQERSSGTRLDTTYAPDGSITGLRYVKTYPTGPRTLWTIYAPRLLLFSLAKCLFIQSAILVAKFVSAMEAAERRALENGEEPPSLVSSFPSNDIDIVVKRSCVFFVRDVAVQSVRQLLDIWAGRKLSPQMAWKLRKGFKFSAVRKRFLPWYQRLTRTSRTVFTSSILSSLADFSVNSTVDVYRMNKAARLHRHHKEALFRRLLLRLTANALKSMVCLVGAAAGAGLASIVWPGAGTVIGYNVADLSISIWLIGPFTEKYISLEPPPAALDAGQLEGEPPLQGPEVVDPAGTIRELNASGELSDDSGLESPAQADFAIGGHAGALSTMQDLD